jgi:hypothetical protein
VIIDDDINFIIETATTRPAKLGRPFTHWSIRKLVAYLADNLSIFQPSQLAAPVTLPATTSTVSELNRYKVLLPRDLP